MNEKTRVTWRAALRVCAPVAMGYLPAGIAYGVLMRAAGLPGWLALAMSVFVFAGSAQYAAIAMFQAAAGVGAMAINTALINLRHVFYAIPLMDALPERGFARAYTLFALTDESFSVLTTLPEPLRRGAFVKVVALNQAFWVAATAIGVGIGGGLNRLVPHLDFALTCLFLILGYEQWRMHRRLWPCVLAIIAFILARTLTPQWLLLCAIGLCALGIGLRAQIKGAGHDA